MLLVQNTKVHMITFTTISPAPPNNGRIRLPLMEGKFKYFLNRETVLVDLDVKTIAVIAENNKITDV